ncbi:MAG: GNAT family N-acetyltransferase [Planctomycetia bacterium]|nr:GNAT family N-acetyltransferase [Planctomycetia bacterium]
MRIELPQGHLRPWRLDDADALVRHANNRHIWQNLRDAFPHPYTAEDADRWLPTAVGNNPPTSFAIVIGDEPVGGIGIVPKDDVYRRSAELGYWLSEEHWGRGITTDAVRAIVDYAFATFDLCRLYAGVFDWNPASARVLEKAGFTFEARLRRAVTKDGRTADELVYALVRD